MNCYHSKEIQLTSQTAPEHWGVSVIMAAPLTQNATCLVFALHSDQLRVLPVERVDVSVSSEWTSACIIDCSTLVENREGRNQPLFLEFTGLT